MREDYTDITFILDKSASMAGVTSDTIGGFNKFLKDQKEEEGKATFTLYQFASGSIMVHNAIDIKEVEELTNKNYIADGHSTSLLDAVGKAINETGKRLREMNDKDRPAKVIVVIQTDGQENSSHEFTWQRIQEMIKHQEDKYSWKFVFLGANLAAAEQADMMGIHAMNTLQYSNTGRGNAAAYNSVSKGMKKLRRAVQSDYVNFSLFDMEDKIEQHKIDPTIKTTS